MFYLWCCSWIHYIYDILLHIHRSLCPWRTFSGPGLDPCDTGPIMDRPSRPLSLNKLKKNVIPLYFSMMKIDIHWCSKKKKRGTMHFSCKRWWQKSTRRGYVANKRAEGKGHQWGDGERAIFEEVEVNIVKITIK